MSIPFVFNYPGNKYREFKTFKHFIELNNKKIIIEPFCGTSSMSFNIWKENKDSKDLIFVLNDFDKNLFYLYQQIKKLSPDEFENELNKYQYLRESKEIWNKNKDLSFNNPFIYVVYNNYYNMRPFLFCPLDIKRKKGDYKLNKLKREFFEFINSDNVIIRNNDWLDVFNEYKDNEEALFLMDPPYMDSCNDFYKLNKELKNTNIYEYFFNNSSVKYKCSIYFILEYNWIIRLLFKNKTTFEYEKTYNMSHKKTIHAIIKL